MTKSNSWITSLHQSLLDGTIDVRHRQRIYARLPRPLLMILITSACIAVWWELLCVPAWTGGYNANDVFNRTLGFERSFVISMPSRTDRHDTFTLASSFADFDFELIDGVDASKMSPKALPVTWNTTTHPMGRLGCWRANMDLLQKIVRDKIQTAIIFQDDADFDVTIKQQLAQFARATRALQKTSIHSLNSSPYGDAWDLLWLGHASVASTYAPTQFYVIENDPTVPPLTRRHGLFFTKKLPFELLKDNTRFVFQATHNAWGLAAYAITYEGARKVLAALSLSPNNEATDLNFSSLCDQPEGLPFACYAPYPTLIGVYRPEGPKSHDSEIRAFDDKAWHRSYSFDVVYSMKQNLMHMANGDSVAAAQWPSEVKAPTRSINERLVTGKEYLTRIALDEAEETLSPGINAFRTLDGGVAWEEGVEVEDVLGG